MPGLPDLAKDLAREYRITHADAVELIQFINFDMLRRLADGQQLHIDRFGSFKIENGSVMFNPSKFMKEYISKDQNKCEVTGED